MNENREATVPGSIVDTVFDLGTTWAAYGLNVGKTALVEAARALETSAKTLGDLATRIAPPAVDSPHGGSDKAAASSGEATQ